MAANTLNSESEPLMGTVSSVALVGLLRTLFVGHRSGRLVFSREAENLSLQFLDGSIVADALEPVGGGFGELLVHSGALPRAEVDLAAAQAAREGRRLESVLANHGVLSRGQLEDALRLHVRGVVFDVFSWGTGFYKFEPDTTAPTGSEAPLRFDTAQIILELINCLERPSDVREALGDLGQSLAVVANPRVHLEGVTLSPTDAFVLSRADGRLTARDLLQITPLSRETVERSLLSLISVGVVEYRAPRTRHTETEAGPTPTAARQVRERASDHQEVQDIFAALSGKSHHEVLGVPTTASADELRAAYFRLTRRFHPDAVGTAPADVQAKAKAVFLRLDEAYNTLRSAEPKPAAPAPRAAATPAAAAAPAAPPPPVLTIEESLQAAEAVFPERPWEALSLLEDLIPRASGPLQQRARLLRARVLLKTPSSERAAEIELREILQEDPASIDTLLVLGAFYRDRGLVARAAGMFRKVLETSPGHRRASAELEALAVTDAKPAKRARSSVRA